MISQLQPFQQLKTTCSTLLIRQWDLDIVKQGQIRWQ